MLVKNSFSMLSFEYVERGPLLVKSVEMLKAVGIFSYFTALSDCTGTYSDSYLDAEDDFEDSCVSVGELPPSLSQTRITLMDGIVSESFVLFLSGVTIAVAGFLAEVIAEMLSRLGSSLKRTIQSFTIGFG